jgi:hypothetical protein
MDNGSSFHRLCNIGNKSWRELPAEQPSFRGRTGILAEIASRRPNPVEPAVFGRQAPVDIQWAVNAQTKQDNPLELCVLLTWLITNRLQLRGGLVNCGPINRVTIVTHVTAAGRTQLG